MKRIFIKPIVLALTFALLLGTMAAQTTIAQGPTPGQNNRLISSSGTTNFQPNGIGPDGIQSPELAPGLDNPTAANPPIHRSLSHEHGPKAAILQPPVVNSSPIVNDNAKLATSFDGLRHRDQRLANGGNQFSLEPPDQGLCVGGGFVLEAVNDVLRVYDQTGAALIGVTDLNTFYGYAAQFNRTTGLEGPFVTDPSCYYDPGTQRWFMVVLTLDVVPTSGAFTGRNHLDLAVSKTSSPLGSWNLYTIPAQDDGTEGTPNHGCFKKPPSPGVTNPGACLGDFPHIGADKFGFYITTNEYELFGNNFITAQIYAISKSALAAGAATITVVHFDNVLAGGKPGFTVWPAEAPASIYATNNHGTEYFLSSTAADEVNCPTFTCNLPGLSNNIVLWALTNSQSLNNVSPTPKLSNHVLRSEVYGVPPPSEQKAGDFPLGQCINDTTTVITSLGPPFTGCWKAFFATEPAHNEVEGPLDSSDSRMMQTTFAAGKVWGALDTVVSVNGAIKAGVAYFIVNPVVSGNGDVSSASNIAKQGYVATAHNNLDYPAIAVLPNGNGVMAFTLAGFLYYPSAGYAFIDATNGVGDLHVAAAGLGPQDGFTEYKAFSNPPRPRWGDYGAAVADGNSIWIASEYIGQTCTFTQYITAPFGSCGATRTSLANWHTRISQVNP